MNEPKTKNRKVSRSLSTRNVLDIVHERFSGFDGVFLEVLGTLDTITGLMVAPETSGVWIIYGKEKNGKSWGALILADYLSRFVRALYVSGEEGLRSTFQMAIRRAKIDPQNNSLQFIGYEPLEDLKVRLRRRNAPKVVFLDNATIYNDEIKGSENIGKLKDEFPHVLFILIAHEERNEPYTALGKLSKKLADIIIRVVGLKLVISGRCTGGSLNIDEDKAALYHGQNLN